jgi:hypothetical protein
LKDTRCRRGADVSSDHILVVAKMKLCLRSRRRVWERKKFDLERLKIDDVGDRFEEETYNRFEVLRDSELDDMEEYWRDYRDMLKESAEEVLGYGREKKKKWISEEAWEKMAERKELKKKMNEVENALVEREELKVQYRNKDNEVKSCVRKDVRNYVDRRAAEAEQAAKSHNSRALFQISKSLGKQKREGNAGAVRDKDKVILMTEKDQVERWVEHFQEVLNHDIPDRVPTFEKGEPLPITIDPPSTEEVQEAISGMKNNKAAGCDSLTAELFKISVSSSSMILQKLFDKIWSEEKISSEWLKVSIIKLSKKEGKSGK